MSLAILAGLLLLVFALLEDEVPVSFDQGSLQTLFSCVCLILSQLSLILMFVLSCFVFRFPHQGVVGLAASFLPPSFLLVGLIPIFCWIRLVWRKMRSWNFPLLFLSAIFAVLNCFLFSFLLHLGYLDCSGSKLCSFL